MTGTVLKKLTGIFCFVFILASAGISQISVIGGKGLSRVLEADPITATDIFLSTNVTSFMKQHGSSVALTKYHRFNINLTVGLANYLECFVNFVPYQEDQQNTWGRIGDTHFGLKYLTPLSSKVVKLVNPSRSLKA